MIEEFLDLVDRRLYPRSGSVFYSGRNAFEQASALYVLGLNPGGNPVSQADETIGRHIRLALGGTRDWWSEYTDESWRGKLPGTHGMQPRILHLMKRLGLDPRATPSSNVVFVRSTSEADLKSEKAALLAACWLVHKAVIDRLGVKVILCLGRTAGKWVRGALGAHDPVDAYVETLPRRRWTSTTHRNASGQQVVTLTHPGRANWLSPASDPTDLVLRALARVPGQRRKRPSARSMS